MKNSLGAHGVERSVVADHVGHIHSGHHGVAVEHVSSSAVHFHGSKVPYTFFDSKVVVSRSCFNSKRDETKQKQGYNGLLHFCVARERERERERVCVVSVCACVVCGVSVIFLFIFLKEEEAYE